MRTVSLPDISWSNFYYYYFVEKLNNKFTQSQQEFIILLNSLIEAIIKLFELVHLVIGQFGIGLRKHFGK